MAYVTCTGKENGTRRLFFSTIFPAQLQIFCAWQEKAPLNQTGSGWMPYIPLFLYSFRWNIEVSYYEQKSFWSLCAYMVRSRRGIEMLVNLINISYCAMKLLPYMEEALSQYRNSSAAASCIVITRFLAGKGKVTVYRQTAAMLCRPAFFPGRGWRQII